MTVEDIKGFTNRIVAGNRSQIICVLFDIYKVNEKDALSALAAGEKENAVKSMNKCTEVLMHLKDALDFKYDIANELYPLYDFCQREISKSIYKANDEGLLVASPIMEKLADAFDKVAEQDTSAPIMMNTQEIHAGYTYGKAGMTEQVSEGTSRPRGFFA